jgi:glycosyltransferase involved in cell wall biosynthesis
MIRAYYTAGGRVIYLDDQDSILNRGGYTLATTEQIEASQARRGVYPKDFTVINFPYWSQSANVFGYGTVAYNLKKYAPNHKLYLSTDSNQQHAISLVYKPVCGIDQGDKTYGFLKNHYESFNDTNRPFIIMYTMFETTRLPEKWVEHLNAYCDLVLVPTKWLIKVFKDSGVKKPIEILAHGTDEEFNLVERPEKVNGNFRFIHYNAGEERKGYKEIIDAFNAEFKKGEKVELILKTSALSKPCYEYIETKKQDLKNEIKIINGFYTKARLQDLLASSHCFVFPSKGEGFGLTPIEAIKTGLPTILTKGHGFLDFWNEACIEVKHKLEPAQYGLEYFTNKKDMGLWYQTDQKDLQKQMRYAFENWKEIRKNGIKGSQTLSKNFNWDLVTKDLKSIIEKYVTKKISNN